MLSTNTFLETRIQRLHDGLIFIEKRLGVHVQRMIKMRRVYALAEMLSKIFAKKRRKIRDLIYDNGLTDLSALLCFLDGFSIAVPVFSY